MIKICQNVLCGVEFEPTQQLQKRQKYCHKCAQLPVKARRRVEPIADKICQNPACGKTFAPRPNLANRQKHCCAYCQRQHVKITSRSSGAVNVRVALPYVEATCPMCGKTHDVAMIWIGRFKPRKFCPTCDEYRKSERFSGLLYCDHVFQASF